MVLITRNYYWPELEKWVRNYVRTCETCQRNKTTRHKKYGPLKLLDIPYHPWEHISMYFIIDLAKVGGYEQNWVVVDRFLKMDHFIPLKNRQAGNLAKGFVREI